MLNFPHWWPAVLMAAGWVLICWITSRVGGWALLAKVYPAQDSNALDGESWRFQSIQVRWAANYGNCVTFKANPLGLDFPVLWLLRIGHPALLIPWSDIINHRLRRSRFFPSFIEFRFRLEPSIPIRVMNKLFLKILDSSDRFHPHFRHISPQHEGPSLMK